MFNYAHLAVLEREAVLGRRPGQPEAARHDDRGRREGVVQELEAPAVEDAAANRAQRLPGVRREDARGVDAVAGLED